ncbi:hypothetical protein AN958_11606 [Leucoagaricus sp. SymC.cos]|nr:hypothetical protein AN958_11606 [Leucoagaricus sp. SymC.cos]
MRDSLHRYGHQQPLLFYTDNMNDKQLLESVFPSLRNNVVPLEKHAHLTPFELPEDVQVFVKDTTHSIDDAALTILNDVPTDGGEIVVGFDTEWNVELTPQGFVRTSGKTAILQIAYKKRVYILQISKMLEKGEVPHQLELLLSNPRIRKAGQLVNGDLISLEKACGKKSGERLPKCGVSMQHIQASLSDFTLHHNLLVSISSLWYSVFTNSVCILKVSTYNSTGQHYCGHFSIWVTNQIQELQMALRNMFTRPVYINGWTNGNLYAPTSEMIGILLIPDNIWRSSNHAFSPQSGEPHWCDAVIVWNQHADEMDGVYYKLVEQLKVHYNKWKTNIHVHDELAVSAKARHPLACIIHDPHCSLIVPPVPTSMLQPHCIENGLADIDMPEIPSPVVMQQMQYFPDSSSSSNPTFGRSTSNPEAPQTGTHLGKAQRRLRTCQKCAKPDCKGKQAVSDCKNPCRNCGKVDCHGQNSHRPDLPCSEGWD